MGSATSLIHVPNTQAWQFVSKDYRALNYTGQRQARRAIEHDQSQIV
jgi:hypothetical protein